MTSTGRSCSALLAVLLTACSSDSPTFDVPDPVEPEPIAAEIVSWIQQNAVPFTTAEPVGDLSDLLPLRDMIGDARVVALGEATHGTREFFQMKDRLLRFLVQEMDFNVFAIEATWPEGNRLDDWVLGGPGDPAVLLSGLYFWTWNTEAVLEMIRWMRAHNEGAGAARPTRFYGFDMQFPGMGIHNVEAYVDSVDPDNSAFVATQFDCLRPFANGPNGQVSGPDYGAEQAAFRDTCSNALEAVSDLLTVNQQAYEAASSAEAYAHALRSARVVVQYESMKSQRAAGGRDQFMAENAVWLLDQAGPDAKIVLWAHNFHVSTLSNAMGSYLRQEYGDDMVVLGFDFLQGSFTAVTQSSNGDFIGLAEHSVGVPGRDTYEFHFASAALPRMLLDLRGVDFGSPATSWLAGPRRLRSIGCCYRPTSPSSFFTTIELPNRFDVMIYFENTGPTRVLPFRYPTNF